MLARSPLSTDGRSRPQPALRWYRRALVAIAAVFTVAFVVLVLPALADDGGDVVGGMADGFVNPYASGYSWDVYCSLAVLAVWVAHERVALGQRRGWICLLLGCVPGVAVGLASYLLLRSLRPPDAAPPAGGDGADG
jgi:hypothetical protein